MKRVALLVLAVALAAPLAVMSSSPIAGAQSTTTDLLPDLGMMQLKDIQIQKTSDGHKLLRFTTRIVNGGAGPFELQGTRTDTSSPWTVTQKIYDSSSGYRKVSTPATLIWGGDGHNHWHVNNLQRYELDRSDNGSKVGTGAKAGFCFYDNTQFNLSLPGAPQSSQYVSPPACQPNNQSATQVPMGLSVGWGDTYNYSLPGQYIDITGQGAGRYRLWATADPDNWFTESSDNNNSTYCDIQLKAKGNAVSVLSCDPGLQVP